jgi:hypothetical protein
LIAEIASLDVAYESGDVKETEWQSKRARLKSLLLESDDA